MTKEKITTHEELAKIKIEEFTKKIEKEFPECNKFKEAESYVKLKKGECFVGKPEVSLISDFLYDNIDLSIFYWMGKGSKQAGDRLLINFRNSNKRDTKYEIKIKNHKDNLFDVFGYLDIISDIIIEKPNEKVLIEELEKIKAELRSNDEIARRKASKDPKGY